MSETFAHRLKHFAFSVDIVEEDTLNSIWDLAAEYLTLELGLVYFVLLTKGEVNNTDGLTCRLSSTSKKPSLSIRTPEGTFNGLAAYSYNEKKPLWIVSSDKNAIRQPTPNATANQPPITDKWSNITRLPIFTPAQDDIKTAIFLPLSSNNDVRGLLDLQTTHYLEPTLIAKKELQLTADAMAALLVLSEERETQQGHKDDAIKMLTAALHEENSPPLTPQIFISSSSTADPKIMGIIVDTLQKFSDYLQIYFWKEDTTAGNITLEILKKTKASRFGLCYFSEPAPSSNNEYDYQDNENVVFEAGMFQALMNPSPLDEPTGWIPIRESNSPPVPFNFAQKRMIFIERHNGKINEEALRASLKERIESLIGITSNK